MTDDHVCVSVTDESGQVVARARVSPDLDGRGHEALADLVSAALRLIAERDAADPEGAAERVGRYEAGQQRIRDRNQRLRGEAS